ncbi:MAG: type VI secretion system baseplate subunit TssK [Pseudomonadales bacterium]|nr:type VI secretion system baseplate subunit TssK [Pseudomonadales bacterium]
MASANKVIWQEGMLLSPQHFQQQTRYVEKYIESRVSSVGPYLWGLFDYALDPELLKLGKLALSRCIGIFPDGTPINCPEIDELPPVIEVPENTHSTIVYLAISLRRYGSQEVSEHQQDNASHRFFGKEFSVIDDASDSGEMAPITVGRLSLQLILGNQDLSGYACIGVAHIVERRDSKEIILDDQYIPPCLKSRVSPRLHGFLAELAGLLHHRGESLAGRLKDSGRSGSAEVADYLLLQLVNRWEPMIQHFSEVDGVHPETLYQHLISLAGELATFTSTEKRPPTFVPYRHDQLQESFMPILAALRQCLSMVMEQSAINMELVERKYGIKVAAITDRNLVSTGTFVLAVKAHVPTEQLRGGFPAQVKIAPVEKIRQLVNAQMPGIGLRALPVAPRQIPYHSGFTYFELETNSEYWTEMQKSGGFALHVGGDFPGLELEFWAIRG